LTAGREVQIIENMSTRPSPITESVVDEYELEYDFADTKTKGNVVVSVLGNTETHKMRIGAKLVGEYRKDATRKEDAGKTYLLGRKHKIQLGVGNLLAGVLFKCHQMRVRKMNQVKGTAP
jgi:hypothetical protein